MACQEQKLKFKNKIKNIIHDKLLRVTCYVLRGRRGMTLIEVLVVIAIMLILMAAVFINPRPSADLDRAAHQLASDLRRAQNMAMAAEVQDVNPLPLPHVPIYRVPCGYGIFLTNDKKQYIIFYNNVDPCSGDTKKHGGALGDLETINLKNDYGIEVTNGQSLSIYFITPSGSCYIDNGSTTELGIKLTASDGSTRTVTITSAGKIEIQ